MELRVYLGDKYMKHLMLKFNHGVEIGARLAYLGHHERTNDPKILSIATDELGHRASLKLMLNKLDEKPSRAIDISFTLIGNSIKFLCRFCPLWSLDFVARSLELFAIFNYQKLKIKYPQWEKNWDHIIEGEKDHEEYFRLGSWKYNEINNLRKSIGSGTY